MVTAVIPNWNGERFLDAVLGDLAAQTEPPARVIVVDNGSSDGSIGIARGHRAWVVALEANRGFAHAVNRGVAAAATELVAILNNDVRLAPTWLATLKAALRVDPSASFATGKIYSLQQEGMLDGAYDLLSRGATAWRAGNGRRDAPCWNEPRRIYFAPFTALLVRHRLFTEIGPLDESFESYLEDIDFGMRCALAGRSGAYVPEAIARHWGSATLGVWHPETVRRIARNQLFLVAKHYPGGWPLRYGWSVLVAQLLYGLLALRRRAAVGFLRGKWEGALRFDELRARTVRSDPHKFAEVFNESELTIFELQKYTGFDQYWSLYFAMTARHSK